MHSYSREAGVVVVSHVPSAGTWSFISGLWGLLDSVPLALESPLDSRDIKPVNPKGNQP